MQVRVLLLVDGHDTGELLSALARLLRLDTAELLLVYVRGPSPRAGLELMRHRPGRHGLLPHRERELAEAERAGGDEALEEAARLAASLAKEPKTLQLSGEPGRAVCEAATRERADLVVVRAAGRDVPPVGPRSLGPVARFITDHCPCPVLLLRSAS